MEADHGQLRRRHDRRRLPAAGRGGHDEPPRVHGQPAARGIPGAGLRPLGGDQPDDGRRLPTLTRIFLVRHADVENPQRVLYGYLPDFHLSALGRAQSAALGERLRPAGLTRIVSSPLVRARETAEVIAEKLTPPPALETDSDLREAEFSRYLQGVPYWQVPVRRPLWLVHKARRGLLPGDESIEVLGERVLRVARLLARRHPGEAMAVVSHADPLNAAWILLDGRPHSEREMHRKSIGKAGMLQVDMEGETPKAWEYIPPPPIAKPASAAA
ncbi:MAG: histidine phosphatase family protein [Chloroflexi bacterium]|nr:MAG: histidine phosphatase family protein [Chloroflexota bacterium]